MAAMINPISSITSLGNMKFSGMWVIIFWIVILIGIMGIVLIVVLFKKKYPQTAIIVDIDNQGKFKMIHKKGRAGRVYKSNADGVKDYFNVKINGFLDKPLKISAPNFVDEIVKDIKNKNGAIVLGRTENDVLFPIAGKIMDGDFRIESIPKDVKFGHLLNTRDIRDLTKKKENLLMQLLPYMIVIVGFVLVAIFNFALLDRISTLIDKINIPKCSAQAVTQPVAPQLIP
jgi:hypothetical protein